jgi:peptide deformylase
MIQPIYLYGAEVLRRRAEEVDLADKEGIATLVQDLKDTLANADGCGLAAPQIGESVRVLIVDGRDMTDVYPYLDGFTRVMINPVVLEQSDKKIVY